VTTQTIDKYQLRTLMVRRDFPGVMRILQCLVVILFAGYFLSRAEHPAMQTGLILVLGLQLTFLFAPLHESIHKTAFDSPWLNQVVGMICGFILFLPPKAFQAFHMAHHRYTQVEGRDPELVMQKPVSTEQYLWNLSGIPYWKGQLKSLILFAVGNHQVNYINHQRYPDVVREARIFVAIYVALLLISIISQSGILLKFWILPVLLGQPFLRAFLLAEHVLCPRVENMFRNTRTTLTNSSMRWLCWNMCFHTEHHAYPGIPFYQLPQTHILLKPHIRNISQGYIAVNREVVRSFQGY